LPPFTSEDGGRWYTGTANAIFENMDYLEELNPEYVLVLSGDHIYKMDYNHLLKAHQEKGASATIAVMEVPWVEASRFGILNVDEDNKIIEFDEKPAYPKNNMASMGIYMFNWRDLKKHLIKDHVDPKSDHDFGKNVLPQMLEEGNPMYAWSFRGYWKDVGTVRSYWEANMDLLDENNTLNIYDRSWRIYTKNKNLPPQYIARGAIIRNSLINEGCYIQGELNNSRLFSEIEVEEGAIINNSVILANWIIREGDEIKNAVGLEGLTVERDEKIGEKDDRSVNLVSNERRLIE